jgi:hypothetical protein
MPDLDTTRCANIADRKGASSRGAVVIPFPNRAPQVAPSLMTRLLASFALAAGCLYPECVVPLLALNETVARRVARSPAGTGGRLRDGVLP